MFGIMLEPLIAKPSAIDTVNQMQDRRRSFVERMIQEEALGLLAANKGLTLDRWGVGHGFGHPSDIPLVRCSKVHVIM